MDDCEQPDEKKGLEEKAASYRYWVRETTAAAAPLPLPKKISSDEHNARHLSNTPSLGSPWNSAGTWEEKCLNKWAADRIRDLITSVDSMEFSGGRAHITDVSKCSGDAFMVTVRNKKRVGYTYELTLDVKGEWIVESETKVFKSYLDIPEFSFGEIDDLQMEVRLKDEEKNLPLANKTCIVENLKQFLHPVQEKLLQFEQELKDR